MDTLVEKLQEKTFKLENENKLLEQNSLISETQRVETTKELLVVKTDLVKTEKDYAKEKKRKKFWRSLAISETGILIIVGILVFL